MDPLRLTGCPSSIVSGPLPRRAPSRLATTVVVGAMVLLYGASIATADLLKSVPPGARAPEDRSRGAAPFSVTCGQDCGGSGGSPPWLLITFLVGDGLGQVCVHPSAWTCAGHVFSNSESGYFLTGGVYSIAPWYNASVPYAFGQWTTNAGTFTSGYSESSTPTDNFTALTRGGYVNLDDKYDWGCFSTWGGSTLVDTSLKVTAASGEFTVPSVSWASNCLQGLGYCQYGQQVAEWIGLGGALGSTSVWQADVTVAMPTSGSVVTSVWYEYYTPSDPYGSVPLTLAVSVGDTVEIQVWTTATTSYHWVGDVTTSQHVTGSYPSASPTSSAEWIVEMPHPSAGGWELLDNPSPIVISYPAATYSCSMYVCGTGAATYEMPMLFEQLNTTPGLVCGPGCRIAQDETPGPINYNLASQPDSYSWY